jgi:hypothetical protein
MFTDPVCGMEVHESTAPAKTFSKALSTTSAPEHAWAHFRTTRATTWMRSLNASCNISRIRTLPCNNREQVLCC